MLQVPFYLNHGHRCAQAAMKSVLAVRKNSRVPTFKELDQLTGRSDGQITLPCQVAYALSKLSINFQYFVKPRWLELTSYDLLGESLKESYGAKSGDILKKINLEAMHESVQGLRGHRGVLTVPQKPTLDELKKQIGFGNIPLCLINFDTFVDRENNFSGHYVVLTDVDDSQITYHNNGPCDAGANLKMSKERFERSWNLCFFDHDLILVN